MLAALVTFLLAGAIMVLSAVVLTRAADALAALTGLGRFWMGSILLAAATSLPELGVNVAAAREGALDLATANIFGSNMANMLILAGLGLVPPRDHVFERASMGHTLAASVGVILQAVAAMLILTRSDTTVAGVSPFAVLLVALFAVGSSVIFRQGAGDTADHRDAVAPGTTVAALVRRFVLSAMVLLVASPLFARSAETLAKETGLGATLFGAVFVGMATSLPEIVASLTAMRLGAFDLAVGNLFGSNLFNITIFLPMDLAYGGAAVFSGVHSSQVVTALFGLLLTALGGASIAFRASRRYALVEPGSMLLIVAYLVGVVTLYLVRGSA